MIMDACDQTDIDCPFYEAAPKDYVGADRIDIKMGAVLIHGSNAGAGLYLYPVDERVCKGQNFWVTNVVHAITEYQTRVGCLPRKLYLQMDSSSENKNWSVASFSQWLVEKGIFEKVKCSFLPVGHTHEDIDANFGRMSQAMRRTTCFTWGDVLAVVVKSVNSLTRGIFPVGVSSLQMKPN
jgi:hypothetical protein